MLEIKTPETVEETDHVRQMCWEYRDFLMSLGPEDVRIVTTFYPKDRYAALMAALEREHAAPAGGLKLALKDGAPVGCGMFHTVLPGAAEIKRVYVRDSARGLGAGRALMQALMDDCRARGFERIVMDTGRVQVAAQQLYLSLGFRLRGPYQEIPPETLDRLVFFEMTL